MTIDTIRLQVVMVISIVTSNHSFIMVTAGTSNRSVLLIGRLPV